MAQRIVIVVRCAERAVASPPKHRSDEARGLPRLANPKCSAQEMPQGLASKAAASPAGAAPAGAAAPSCADPIRPIPEPSADRCT